jgi:hypothetical protein
MKTAEQWLPELREWVGMVERDPPSIGVLSMGQRCAVALVVDDTMLEFKNEKGAVAVIDPRPDGYTWLDCVHRIEGELLAAAIKLQRDRV